ncbi:hypothetical protein [Streptomyces sp. NPDC051183]|uniref:hypothetical protein n=1 Tax=Streptomyces sp. NPDC051183 TaxID=3155165 RepID=UPI00341C5E40
MKNNLARVRKSGQKTAVCFEFQHPQQQAGFKQLAPPVASSGVWCDAAPMDKSVVTRFAICSVRNVLILLIDTKTGATLGKATGIIEQEIDTAISSVEFSEHLTFKLVKSEITTSAMTVKIDSTCSVDGSCRQDTQPWSSPRPITVGGSIDGTWTRSWTGNVGHKEFLIDYAITVSMAGTSGTARWGGNGQPGGGQYKVRCDNEFATYAGCVVPAAIMTLDVNPIYSGARKYIAAAQESMNTHPGWEGHGQPLHREASKLEGGMNRSVICDGTFRESSSTPPPVQCDEWPFAGSKESGRSQGVKSGAECQQYFVYATTDSSGAPTLGLMWPGFLQGMMPSPTAKCARASMTKFDNEGVGGDFGRLIQKWRLIDNDPFWVNSGAGLPW